MATTSRKSTPKGSKSSAAKLRKFTDEERAAMKERSREAGKTGGESDVLAKIAEMPKADRVIAEKVHALIRSSAPDLSPKTWYGMPAYAKDGKVVCHFQSAQKFKTRYATLGFSDQAHLDDGAVWPVTFALKEFSAEVEATISSLVHRSRGSR